MIPMLWCDLVLNNTGASISFMTCDSTWNSAPISFSFVWNSTRQSYSVRQQNPRTGSQVFIDRNHVMFTKEMEIDRTLTCMMSRRRCLHLQFYYIGILFAGNFKSQTRKFKSFPSLLQSFLFGSPPEDVFSHFDSGRASTTSHFFVEPCAPLHLNLWMTWDVRNLVSLTFFTLRITGSILPFIVPSNLHATWCRLWDGESSSGIMWDERRLAGFHLTCPEKTKTGNWLNHRPRPCR